MQKRTLGRWVLAGALVVSVGAALGVASRAFELSSPLLTGRATQSVRIIRATPNVVTAIRDLSRLESAEFHLERVIDAKNRQSKAFGLLEVEDALLLVAAGDVVAGIELDGLSESDVRVDHGARSVHVTLPPPKILSARLDSQRTYVHSRKTDLLAGHDEKLEGEARAQAERELAAAALEAKILEKAAKNAQKTVADLLRALGFTQVTVESRSA